MKARQDNADARASNKAIHNTYEHFKPIVCFEDLLNEFDELRWVLHPTFPRNLADLWAMSQWALNNLFSEEIKDTPNKSNCMCLQL